MTSQIKERYSKHPPYMPVELHTGTEGKRQARLKIRKQFMENAYPGTIFSTSGHNPLAVKQSKNVPGIGSPLAIFDISIDPIDSMSIVMDVIYSYNSFEQPTMYVTYNQIKYATGLSFRDVMGVIQFLRQLSPNCTFFTVDRLGYNVAFRLTANHPIFQVVNNESTIQTD
jgi:hypothetical protein